MRAVSSLYSHLSIEALQKNLSDLSARLPSLAQQDRKYILGNIRAILDELEERELSSKKSASDRIGEAVEGAANPRRKNAAK